MVEVGKNTANIELGQEINREYQRVKNAAEGRPTDQYTDLGGDEAALLGDAFKEMYAEANPTDLKRVTPEGSEGHVTFQITPEGETRLNSPAAKAKRAVMFPGVNLRPSKTPITGPKGQLQGETARVRARKATGKVKGTPAGMAVLDEARENLAQVPNVVDKQRLRILYSTILPVLSLPNDQFVEALESDPILMTFATINNMGRSQLNKFRAEAKKAERDGVEYDLTSEINGIRRTIAQNVRAIAMERNGANYLSYYIQNFNGRMAPQQSYFDPTTSKAVRFVTTNAVPAKATPGSRIEKNLRQMYAMMLVKDADALLPPGREAALDRAGPQLEQWGNRLAQLLEESMTDAQAEQISQAIEQGMPLTDQNFPQAGRLGLDPTQDAELIKMIEGKGEDGPHWIDGVIDYANYAKAKREGKPHFSYFNAYMDGKTNGIASNGIQMGSRDVAFKTGVLRTNETQLLDEGLDVRVALCNDLMAELETTGIQTSDPNLYTIMRHLYTYKGAAKDLAKGTTMTFGYGKELESFKSDIEAAIDLLVEEQPEVAAAVEAINAGPGDMQSALETIHSTYTNHLAGALSQEALESRPLMRASALLHALADKVMTIETATGFELHLGGEVQTGVEDIGSYQIYGDDGKKRQITATKPVTRATALAAKGDQGPGTRAYGGSLPGPVQSIDAATVAMTSSGKSWDKLTAASNGNPYIHTIYDAFKVDAMGYDVVLDEVNQNWLDAGMNWSYLEATQKATTEMWREFNQDLKNYPDDLPIDSSPDGEFGMFMDLTIIEPRESDGREGPWRLARVLRKTMDLDPQLDPKDAAAEVNPIAVEILKQMKKRGFDRDNPKMKDFKFFLHALNAQLQLGSRLGKMIQKTNNKKAQLKSEIKSSGVPNYQYYAH